MQGTEGQSTKDLYAKLIETIVGAEEMGNESVWVGQHHFGLGNGRLPSPVPLLAATAGRTHKIELGAAVHTLPLEDPIRLAEDLAVLYELAEGRVNVGLGSGGGDREAFRAFGVE